MAKKPGRPRLAIAATPQEVQNYARLGATDTEIAEMIGVPRPTLVRRFRAPLDKGRAERKLRLRQKQTEVALKGNVTMLIWLGKQELGQADKQEVSGPNGGAIPHKVTVTRRVVYPDGANARGIAWTDVGAANGDN